MFCFFAKSTPTNSLKSSDKRRKSLQTQTLINVHINWQNMYSSTLNLTLKKESLKLWLLMLKTLVQVDIFSKTWDHSCINRRFKITVFTLIKVYNKRTNTKAFWLKVKEILTRSQYCFILLYSTTKVVVKLLLFIAFFYYRWWESIKWSQYCFYIAKICATDVKKVQMCLYIAFISNNINTNSINDKSYTFVVTIFDLWTTLFKKENQNVTVIWLAYFIVHCTRWFCSNNRNKTFSETIKIKESAFPPIKTIIINF